MTYIVHTARRIFACILSAYIDFGTVDYTKRTV